MHKNYLKNGDICVINNEFVIYSDGYLRYPTKQCPLSDYNDWLHHNTNESLNVTSVLRFDTKEKKFTKIPSKFFGAQVNEDQLLVETFGMMTLITLRDGTTAFTTCLPEDVYVLDRGIKIAYGKAKIKQIKKKLKELMK